MLFSDRMTLATRGMMVKVHEACTALLSTDVAVTVVTPAPTAVAIPPLLTVTIVGSAEVHVTS